ncbi:BMP family ABC transporter substrate-binding protein [Roseovarius spongiae]|uniref:BMP family ABC transporter substrate-binding protein n=1 Tax=Roseovarius spongiae TaxID=2320272 RepID=A0A3A8B6J2_9RHOB|nr:BMP family protein [Roseovarius spongiae]RKF16745.1 BMP family ABC transporter substrate-binding protein [Roseovarius spongiae]
MRRQLKSAAFAAVTAAATLIALPATAQDAPRVAAALPGIVTDKAFNENIYDGLVAIEDKYGSDIAYTENVSQATQVEVMSDYARRGYDIVIGAGGEYTDAAERVAENFPETTVVVPNGAPTPGVTTINYNNPEFGYLLGVVAGGMSKTGVIAALSAQKFAAFDNVVDGYRRGFQSVQPDGEVLVAYTNDWADVALAKEAAYNLISKDADVLMPYLDGAWVGVVQAAQERGAHTVGILHESESNLVSARLDFARALMMAADLYAEGKLEPKDYVIHLTQDEQLGDFNAIVPEEVQAMARDAIQKIKSGELTFD